MTERLLLRRIGYDDADFFYRQFSNDAVNRYLYDTEPCVSTEEAKEWIGFYLEPEPRNQHRWILALKSTGESIGTCGFHCWNRKIGEVEIGYDLFPTYQRQGFVKTDDSYATLSLFMDTCVRSGKLSEKQNLERIFIWEK